MEDQGKLTRRNFLGGLAALGTMAWAGCAAQTTKESSMASEPLPQRGEFIIKKAYVLTMDQQLGEIPNGDIHVRDGAIVAVGANLTAPRAEIIQADSMIALPGFIETHWHMWGAVARNMAGPTDKTGYFYISRLLGQFFTPEDNARGVRLGLAEAVSSGITTVTNWSHNLLAAEFADEEIKVHQEVGARARFAYGYSRKTPPNATLPLSDVARVQKRWFNPSDKLLTLGIARARAGEQFHRDLPAGMGLRAGTWIAYHEPYGHEHGEGEKASGHSDAGQSGVARSGSGAGACDQSFRR